MMHRSKTARPEPSVEAPPHNAEEVLSIPSTTSALRCVSWRLCARLRLGERRRMSRFQIVDLETRMAMIVRHDGLTLAHLTLAHLAF
jgi:hypothetical protein